MFPIGRPGSWKTSQVPRLHCTDAEIRKLLPTGPAVRMREEQDDAPQECHVDRSTQVLRMSGRRP